MSACILYGMKDFIIINIQARISIHGQGRVSNAIISAPVKYYGFTIGYCHSFMHMLRNAKGHVISIRLVYYNVVEQHVLRIKAKLRLLFKQQSAAVKLEE